MEDYIKKIESVNKKIKDLETKKIRVEQELELLKGQYDQVLQELKKEGVEDINNLPQIISSLEKEISEELKLLDKALQETEYILSQIL